MEQAVFQNRQEGLIAGEFTVNVGSIWNNLFWAKSIVKTEKK